MASSPHLTRPFKLSNDPKFAEKVVDIVGLYLNPPDKAVVLCVDEKGRIQALDRTQPGLPMKKGRARNDDTRDFAIGRRIENLRSNCARSALRPTDVC